MKRTTLVIILLAILLVSCLALTACHTCEFGEWAVTKQPTCTQDGSKERVCECGEKETEVVPATGHTFGDWTEVKAPTCTETGLELRYCHCAATESRVIEAGHDEITHDAQSVTCVEIGWDAYVTCSRCDYTTYKEIPATGHSYENKVCTVCGELKPSDGLEYSSIYGAYYIVSGIGTCKDTDVVISSTYNGKPVTSIGESAFIDCTNLTSITIPKSVKSIEHSAFAGCSSLTSITIPSSVTSIGAATFANCTSLTSIIIPSSVTSIGYGAFQRCTSLTNFVVDANNVNYQSIDGNLYSKDGKTLMNYAVRKTNTSFEIPTGVTSIGEYAFSDCTSLESLIIPSSVTSIGRYAFYYCTSLSNIVVDKNNPNYKSIDGNLYSKDGKTLIQYAIGKTATSFAIPSSITSIGEYAFFACTSLTSVIISKEVTSIGHFAFSMCTNLKSITIPSSVTSIGYGAFYNCNSLNVYYEGTEEQWNNISIEDWLNESLTNANITYNYKG